MPKLEFSERFATDLALVTSQNVEARIMENLDNIERFAEFGSALVPASIKESFGNGVRKVSVNPFDLIYTYYPDCDLVRVEALVHQRSAK